MSYLWHLASDPSKVNFHDRDAINDRNLCQNLITNKTMSCYPHINFNATIYIHLITVTWFLSAEQMLPKAIHLHTHTEVSLSTKWIKKTLSFSAIMVKISLQRCNQRQKLTCENTNTASIRRSRTHYQSTRHTAANTCELARAPDRQLPPVSTFRSAELRLHFGPSERLRPTTATARPRL